MTINDIRTKILDEYKEWFSKRGIDVIWINEIIEEFNIDPCNPNTFEKPIDKLRKELNKTIIPEPIEEAWKNVAKEGEAPFFKTVKTYKSHTEEEAIKIRTEWININQALGYLLGMLNITKLNLPRQSKSKQTSKMKYGLLEQIVLTTIDTDRFKKFNIEKGKTLKQNQQKKIFDLAQELFPNEVINYKSFFTKIKNKGYSKELHNPRKSKK
ncbi:hypothetical protein ACFLSS_03060 [Bacteroidota bacterium]